MQKGRVAKKFALYPPKKIVEKLGLREGQLVSYDVKEGKLVVEPIPDPLDLALRSKKWARTDVKVFEKESEKEQERYG